MAYSTDGPAPPSAPWNANKCVTSNGKLAIGDACEIKDGKYSGVDDCVKGSQCLLTDDEGIGGICVEFCDQNDTCPETPSAVCNVYNDGSLPLCLATCDPIVQDCPDGQGCYNSAGNSFVCFVTSAMGNEGVPGAECAYINQCKPGNICLNADVVQGCQFASCCNPYCAVSEGNGTCNTMEECSPFFEMGMAPPGYEDVGVCALPA